MLTLIDTAGAGGRLARARAGAGLTLAQAAELLGLSDEELGTAEAGARPVSAGLVLACAGLYRVPRASLLYP